MCCGRAGPAQAPAIQALVRYSAIGRGQGCDFIHDLLGMSIVHFVAHPCTQLANNFPVWLAFPGGLDNLSNPLYQTGNIGKGSVFFGKGARRQNDICHFGRLRHKHVLHYDKVHSLQNFSHLVDVRATAHGVGPQGEKTFQPAFIEHHVRFGYPRFLG